MTIEPNPGPFSPVRFGSLNVRGENNAEAAIQDLIHDHQLQALAVSETWIRNDAPDAVKIDMVPPDFAILHAHRPCVTGTTSAKRGGGLAFIHSSLMPAWTIKSNFRPTSFELQLIGSVLIKVANIYRPPSLSKPGFIDEFADLLTSIGVGPSERLIICGDFNLPGADSTTMDDQLQALLDVHGYTQHVTEPTRHDATGNVANLLDLVITSATRAPPLESVFTVHTACRITRSSSASCQRVVRN